MTDLNIYTSFLEVPKIKRVVVLGHFDGIHLGHQALLAAGRRIAKQKNIPLMVFTFYPQSQSLFQPDFKYILSQKDKMAMLKELGVDEVLTIPFSKEISQYTPELFVKKYLLQYLLADHIVVGFDHSFGYKASGKAEDMVRLAAPVPVHVEPPFRLDGAIMSSTMIRDLLKKGNICQSEFFLGYDYTLSGPVVHGLANGRRFLVPTANVSLPKDLLLPKAGVYAATCCLHDRKGEKLDAVLNIGTRPTIDDNPQEIVEAHIIDFDEDIYGKVLSVSDLHFMRGIVKYDSLNALKHAIFQDIEHARIYHKRRREENR